MLSNIQDSDQQTSATFYVISPPRAQRPAPPHAPLHAPTACSRGPHDMVYSSASKPPIHSIAMRITPAQPQSHKSLVAFTQAH
jgi:hypothetical protein